MAKKRRKATRYRGSQTHKRGHRKRTKGSGNQGGYGMAGTGKRGDQKKTLILNLYGKEYFGKDRTLRRGPVAPKLKVINLDDLTERIDTLVKKGIAKLGKGFEFNLIGYKLLGGTKGLASKINVKASAASKSAIEQIKTAGGSIELESDKKKPEEDKEKKEEPKKQ